MSFLYKMLSLILSKKIQATNIALFNRLEKFAELLYNKKYQISFDKNYEILVIQLENKKLFFEGWWLGGISGHFITDVYQKLPVENKTVIDIGANIGESAISFVLRGAKRVIGLEPFPINYEFFKLNILKNNMNKQIETIHGGLSSSSSEIFVDPDLSGLSYKMESSDGGEKINQYTLDELITKFNINDAIIKMNCEGCEYDTILNTSNDILKKILYILIQYHDGHETLMKKLESAGFDVTYEPFAKTRGFIFAENSTLNS